MAHSKKENGKQSDDLPYISNIK